jgi:hypothetical protein
MRETVIEVVDDDMARVLAAKTGAERVQREVARRLSHATE